MPNDLLIPAKLAAELLGLPRVTRNGRPSNHCSFLKRMELQHPETFPLPHWNGTRRYYEQAEILAFKNALPRLKPEKDKAA